MNKIHSHLEAGKFLRYEIPDYIKDVFDKANKFSKDIKKVMIERAPLDKLEKLNEISLTEHKIITNEMLQFESSNILFIYFMRMGILEYIIKGFLKFPFNIGL